MARDDFVEAEHPRGRSGRFTEKNKPQADAADAPSVDLGGQYASTLAAAGEHAEHIPLDALSEQVGAVLSSMPKGSGLVVSVSDGSDSWDGRARSGVWEGRRAEMTSRTRQADNAAAVGQEKSLHRIVAPEVLEGVLAAYEARFSSEAWSERLRAYGKQLETPPKGDEMDSAYTRVLWDVRREGMGADGDRWNEEQCRPIEMPQVEFVNGRLRAVTDHELHDVGDSYGMLMPEAGVLYHCSSDEPEAINIVVPEDRHFSDPDYEGRAVYVRLLAIDGYDPTTGAVTGFGEIVVRYAMPDNGDAAALVMQGHVSRRSGISPERCEDQEPYCDHCEVG